MNTESRKIILMGPQGSGKGTQAKLISDKLGIPNFAMGQLIRDEVAKKTELGKKLNEIIIKGELVSDTDAANLLQLRLQNKDTENGYVLDGYPRNIDQYNAFDFDTPTHVIVIEISTEESLRRLGSRVTCNICGQIDGLDNGVKIGDSCDCGGVWIQRSDDTKEVIERRLDIYNEDTEPVIKKYEEQGSIYKIDGSGDIDQVHDLIMKIIT